mgnify:FL=1
MDTDGKLVRNRIPEIIGAAGGQATTRRLDQAERLPALLAKLQEESDELRTAAFPAEQREELADVLEVLKGIASELSLPWADIESAAAQKRAERGGFEAGIWLQLPPEA